MSVQEDIRYQESMERSLEEIRAVTQIPNGLLSNDAVFGNLLDVCGVKEPGKLLASDYVWKRLSTRVSYPKKVDGWEDKRSNPLDDAKAAIKTERAREGLNTKTFEKDGEYFTLLQKTLKMYLPSLVDNLFSTRPLLTSLWEKGKREDDWMNGITTRKAADFVFEVMALETPMQWEEVKAVPGALFELPKVIVSARTVTAKDLNTAKKECWALASKVEGVDVKRVEVLARPFLG